MKKSNTVATIGLICFITLTLGARSARAQVITFGDLHTISGVSDIDTAGTYVDAVGFLAGGTQGVTVDDNGTNIQFNGVSNTSGVFSDASGDIAFSNIVGIGGDLYNGAASLPTDYRLALLGVAYTGNGQGGPTGTVTLSGLTAGDNYEVEIFQAVSGEPSRYTTYASTGGTPVTTTGGQYVIGSFVADSTDTESFTFTGSTGEINAVELRDLGAAVPEPSTWAMVGVGVVGLLAWRRIRAA